MKNSRYRLALNHCRADRRGEQWCESPKQLKGKIRFCVSLVRDSSVRP